MEKKFYTDDFEQFLKETADDFRMYPSRRVWNSLYNNLHPGRKWPSLSVCLLLVSSIIFIGLSHKNEITGSASIVKNTDLTGNDNNAPLIAALDKENSAFIKENTVAIAPVKNDQTQIIPAIPANSIPVIKDDNRRHPPVTGQKQQQTVRIQVTASQNNAAKPSQATNIISSTDDKNESKEILRRYTSSQANTTIVAANTEDDQNEIAINRLEKNDASILPNGLQQHVEMSIIEKTLPVVTLPSLKTSKNNSEKLWIDDYAFHNQPIPSLKSKLQYQLYITPSVGFRTLKQTASYTAPARPSLVTSVPDGPNALQHDPGFNLEIGYGYVYTQSKKIHIKAGVQLNYTSYIINAHQLGHSTTTNLLLIDSYSSNGIALSQRPSSLANLTGKDNDKKLNNSTVQVSIPLGADIKLAGKHNLQWFIGASIQPTYVLFGNAYLASADSRNYVYDSKFLRKWNLNAGLETFVSYRTKKGISFNAGPQFRYQFLSSYKSKYSFDEKLYNVGIKLGMTRNF